MAMRQTDQNAEKQNNADHYAVWGGVGVFGSYPYMNVDKMTMVAPAANILKRKLSCTDILGLTLTLNRK